MDDKIDNETVKLQNDDLMSVQQAEVDLMRDESLKMVALCQKHTNYLADKAKLQNKYGDLQNIERELNET